MITGVGRRRRWSLEDKARIVAESLDPATTSSAVARRYGLHVDELKLEAAGSLISARITADQAACPTCGRSSSRVHSA